MKDKALVSIIIPVYNSENTVGETLDSVLTQTYPNWEAICVDDGSTDGSYAVLEAYAAKDPRISCQHRTCLEKGGSVCRNIGGFAAKGKYIIFLDSDDLLAPWCLETRLKCIEDTNYDFAVFPIAYFSIDINHYWTYNNLKAKNHLYRFAATTPTWQTMQPIICREFFYKLKGFDITYQRHQDVEFYMRALIMCNGNYHIFESCKPDCYFRHFGSSGNFTKEKSLKAIEAENLLLTYIAEHECYFMYKGLLRISELSILMNMYMACVSTGQKGALKDFVKDNKVHRMFDSLYVGVSRYIIRFVLNLPFYTFFKFCCRANLKLLSILLSAA